MDAAVILKYDLKPNDIDSLWAKLSNRMAGHTMGPKAKQMKLARTKKKYNNILPIATLLKGGLLPLPDANGRLIERYEQSHHYKLSYPKLVKRYNAPDSHDKPTKVVCERDIDYHLEHHRFDSRSNVAFFVAEAQPGNYPIIIGRAVSIKFPDVWMCSKKDEEAVKKFIFNVNKRVAVIGI
jgi:hypothetical protein